MMKKGCCILLALLLMMASLALAEEDAVWIGDDKLFMRADGTVVLHLVICKEGPHACVLEEVGVVFLNAAGQPVRAMETEIHCLLRTIPAGSHLIPIIVTAKVPEGVTVTDYRLVAFQCVGTNDCDVAAAAAPFSYFMMEGANCAEMTAFIDAPADSLPNQFLGYGLIYDAEGAFLGAVELPLGGAEQVAVADMLPAVEKATGIPAAELLRMGFDPAAIGDSLLYAAVPMEHLPEGAIPGSATVAFYQTFPANRKNLEITAMGLEVQPDGTFLLQALMMNKTGAPLRLTEVGEVALQDGAGRTAVCRDYTWVVPYDVIAPGNIVPLRITGKIGPGLDGVVSCGFRTDCEAAEGTGPVPLTGETVLLSQGETVRVQSTITLGEGADATGCYDVTVVLEEEKGNVLACVWNAPGTGTPDGAGKVVMPEIDLGLATSEGTVLMHMYCFEAAR